ncbi:MAG: hypothetical protein AAF289_05660 [Cyanobacteria bacterium P01_A01_bin.135]
MTSNRAKLQTLIDMIDATFGESAPEAQTQAAIAQIRQQLMELQQEGEASQEASARQVLQAVVQEMGYLRANMIQPLRTEISQLYDQRRLLAADVQQLQQRQQQIKASQQQAMLQEFMQSLMARLQDQMTTQVVQAITLMQPQITGAEGESAPNTAQQVEQLRMLQATSNELMLKMDATLRVVFDSLQNTVDDYRDSLGQGLEKMHGLGQQGEALFAALVNRLATQLGREASQYLHQSTASSPEQRGSSLSAGREALSALEQLDRSDSRDLMGDGLEPVEQAGPVTEDVNAMSAAQIDQLLRQNLLQTSAEAEAELEMGSAALSDIDSEALIDEITALEQDIDAISDEIILDELNLNLESIELPATGAPETLGDELEDEAIALFQLDEAGVTINESADPAIAPAAALDTGAAELANDREPEATDAAPQSAEFDVADDTDEIASFYAEFQAATDMPEVGEAETGEAAGTDGESAAEAATASQTDSLDLPNAPLAPSDEALAGAIAPSPAGGEDSEAGADRIHRLSDLIDPDILQQLGSEAPSGASSPYAMASLGEDLLPTAEDVVLTNDIDLDIDQLAADLAQIEPDASDAETDAGMPGFLSPDDDFFAAEQAQQDFISLPPPPSPEAGVDLDSSSSEAVGDLEAPLPTEDAPAQPAVPEPKARRPWIDLPSFGQRAASSDSAEAATPEPEEPGDRNDSPSEPEAGERGADEAIAAADTSDSAEAEDSSKVDIPEANTLGASEAVEDDDVMDEAAIDEIAALFAALERTDNNPAERSTIAQQTLADLLKPSPGANSIPQDAGSSLDDLESATNWSEDQKKK